jgi:predicted metal-dependent phosphoesterase TrpH
MRSDFGRADLHMHTNVSDGAAAVADLLAYVSQHRQLDVIAITDHDKLDAALWAYDHRDQYPFDIVIGTEVTSREGHVLALWIDEKIPTGLNLEDTVQAIHEAGGLAILAHPFQVQICETRQGAQRYFCDMHLIERAGFDGIEVVNAAAFPLGTNGFAKVMCQEVRVACLGNSDAHTPNGVGSGSTRFLGHSAADLRKAIELRQTTALGGMWPLAAYRDYITHLLDGTISYEGAKDYRPS